MAAVPYGRKVVLTGRVNLLYCRWQMTTLLHRHHHHHHVANVSAEITG